MLFGVVVELSGAGLILYGVPFAIVVGWLSGRMLGVRRGWVDRSSGPSAGSAASMIAA